MLCNEYVHGCIYGNVLLDTSSGITHRKHGNTSTRVALQISKFSKICVINISCDIALTEYIFPIGFSPHDIVQNIVVTTQLLSEHLTSSTTFTHVKIYA